MPEERMHEILIFFSQFRIIYVLEFLCDVPMWLYLCQYKVEPWRYPPIIRKTLSCVAFRYFLLHLNMKAPRLCIIGHRCVNIYIYILYRRILTVGGGWMSVVGLIALRAPKTMLLTLFQLKVMQVNSQICVLWHRLYLANRPLTPPAYFSSYLPKCGIRYPTAQLARALATTTADLTSNSMAAE